LALKLINEPKRVFSGWNVQGNDDFVGNIRHSEANSMNGRHYVSLATPDVSITLDSTIYASPRSCEDQSFLETAPPSYRRFSRNQDIHGADFNS
jgi:hypothetical protein